MNWNELRHRWQDCATPPVNGPLIERLRQRDRGLHRRVKWRDALETIVALALVPGFGWGVWFFASHGFWMSTAGSLLLTLWCLFVPLKLRQARRLKPELRPECDMLTYLKQERMALQAQFELLDRIFWWYLGPAAVGVLTLYVGVKGLSWDSAGYTAAVIVVYGLIYRGNKVGAHKRIRPQIEHVEQEILELEMETQR